MSLSPTTLRMPEALPARIDGLVGRRRPGRYILDRAVRRDAARATFRSLAGSLWTSTTWGRDDDEVALELRRLRNGS